MAPSAFPPVLCGPALFSRKTSNSFSDVYLKEWQEYDWLLKDIYMPFFLALAVLRRRYESLGL